jgi:DNA-binding NarL/FixJ family response regulator
VDESKIKVIIADEHYLFRHGIKAMLSSVSGLQVIEEAATAAEVERLAELHGPDLLMLDAALSGPHYDLVKRMKETHPETHVLLVSDAEKNSETDMAAEAGANGWLARNSSALEIVKAIRESAPVAAHPPQSEESRSHSPSKPEHTPTALTRREQEILQLLISGGTSREIAETLNLSIKTVEAHKFNLMRKLDVHSRSELIQLVIRKQVTTYVTEPELAQK